MKKSHIIGIVLIAICLGAIVIVSLKRENLGTYATFNEAAKAQDSEFHVVGKLDKEKEMTYDPQVNTNLFSFYMKDKDGTERKVNLHKTKPQDFERSEQIVLIGKMEGEEFQASDILMKCPSKYNDAKPQVNN
jgi:cytochrome c-type biogenesis protein CcmE